MTGPFLFRVSLDINFAFFTFLLEISPGIEGRAAVVGWRAEARPIIFMQIHIKKSFAPSATSAVIASSQFPILNWGGWVGVGGKNRTNIGSMVYS